MVICLERGADLHMAQLMPLSLTVSCFSKIQIGFYRAMLCIRHGPVSVCLSSALLVLFPSFRYSFPSVIFCPSSFCFPSLIQPFAFIAFTLLVGRQEGYPACKKGCWCGYLSGERCRLAHGPADATATHCLVPAHPVKRVFVVYR